MIVISDINVKLFKDIFKDESTIENIFTDKEYVLDELRRIRKVMTNSQSSIEQIEAVRTVLSFMFLYVNDTSLMSLVEATIFELEYRIPYLLFNGLHSKTIS